jgi:hypothetical protein
LRCVWTAEVDPHGRMPEVPAQSGGGPASSPTGLLHNLGLAPLLCEASEGRGVPREEGEGGEA